MSYRDPIKVGLEIWVKPKTGEPHWLDISEDLLADGIEITRGRSSEAGQVDPASMRCTLRSSDGKYSPRNPRSPLAGMIGRNTPIRSWVDRGRSRLVQWGENDFFAAPPESATVATDLDVRVNINPKFGWRPGYNTWLGAVRWQSWGLALSADGRLSINWWTDANTQKALTSTEKVSGSPVGRKCVRATLDVDNGSGKTVARFYVSDSMAGPWEQLGAPAQSNGTTSIFDSGSEYLTTICARSEIHAVQVLDGIDSTTELASVDFTASYAVQEYDPSGKWRIGLTDDAGVQWQQQGGARLWNRRYRFRGEVSEWPPTWGLTGEPSVVAKITASGVMRRLGTGASPIQSAIRRGCESLGPSLVAYWPCQDGQDAKQLEPAGRYSAGVITGQAGLASYSGFACSDPIVTVESSRLFFSCPAVSATGQIQVRWLNHFPSSDLTVDSVLLRVSLTESIGWVDVLYAASGGLYANVYSRSGSVLKSTNVAGFSANDKNLRLSLELEQFGTDVVLRLVSVEAGFISGLFIEETIAGVVVGSVDTIEVNPTLVDLGSWAFGHLTVEREITSIFDLAIQFAAYTGERADVRTIRLGAENGLVVNTIGRGAGCERMGVQQRGTLLALMRQAAETESGVLFEPRDEYGLQFRTLESICSQVPASVTIPYTDNLLIPFEPVDDDSNIRNMVTVQRAGGASATVEDRTSALSTLPPPDGAGVYDETSTLSLARDGAVIHHAGWKVHLGTVDEARWPRIGLDLAHPQFAGGPVTAEDLEITSDILDLDIGDRMDVTDLPPWLPPGDVQAIIQGYSERIIPAQDAGWPDRPSFSHKIVFNCTPASPYQAATWVASTYLTETSTTTTTETITTGVDPTTLVEDDFTGSNGSAWSGTWSAGFTGSGSITLQNGWGRITVGSSGIVSRRLTTTPGSGAASITGRTATLVESDSATGVTATLPTDRHSGDLAVVVFALSPCTTAQFVGPGGSWTQLVAPTAGAASDETIAAYYQFSPASAPTATSTSGTPGRVTAICQSYGGVSTSSPVDVAAAVTTANSTNNVATGVTTATNGALLLSGLMVDTASRTLVPPSGTSSITNVQGVSATSAAAATSVAATLSSATAGNLLWCAVAYDKDAGTITPPSGFTALLSDTSTSISIWVGYKVAAGGETTITASRSNNSPSGDTIWVGEFADSNSGTWEVITSATNVTAEANVTSLSSGTASDPARTCAAIAFFAIDSTISASGTKTFSNSYATLREWNGTGGIGYGDIAVGWLSSFAGGASTSTTHDHAPTADQVSGAIATFGKNGSGGMTEVEQYNQAGGRALALAQEVRPTAGASGTRTWTWTPSATLASVAFVTALRPSSSSAPKANIRFKYRVSGWVFPEFIMRHNSTTLDRQNDYGIRLPTPQDSNLRLYEHTNYSYSSALGSFPLAVAVGQVIQVRVWVNGPDFKIKAWPDGGVEPVDWQLTATDSTYPDPGYWGFYAGSAGTAGNYLEVDDFHWDDGETGEVTTVVTTTTTTMTSTPVPAGPSPWRWDNPNIELVRDVSGSDTSMQSWPKAGPPFTEDPDDFPFDVILGGEVIRITDAYEIVNLALNPALDTDATQWSTDPGNSTTSVSGRQTVGGFFTAPFYRVTF